MAAVSAEEMLVVNSIRQSFECTCGPGSSVNATQNPFFAQLMGQFDLLQAARLVIERLETHRKLVAEAAKKEADEAAKIAAKP